MKAKPVIIAVVALAVIGGGVVWYRKSHVPTETRYTLAAVTRGTLTVTVAGSGQVSASDQIDMKAKASGTVIRLNVKEGQTVKTGDVVASIDATDALRAVRDAQTNLETAKLSYDKLVAPPDTLTRIQSENSLATAQANLAKANDDLAKSYDDGYTDISKAFLDLPGVVQGLHDVLFLSTIDKYGGRWNIDYITDGLAKYEDTAAEQKAVVTNAYDKARAAFDTTFADYKATPSTADPAVIESLIVQTYDAARTLSDAIKAASNFYDHYADQVTSHGLTVNAAVTAGQTSLKGYTSTVSGQLSALLSASADIKSAKDSITSNNRTIAERTESLKKMQAGADALDIRSQEITIAQRQNTLRDAQEALADYTVRAPLDGVISKVSARLRDDVSSGAAIATVVSDHKYAQISMNEVDAAKIKVGQKAALTFDAIDEFEITGQVATVDAVGAVSQGVVTYGVKIVFDIQDERIRPGMSVSANIITEAKPDVVLVPNAAVKTQGNASYVETIDGVTEVPPAPMTSATAPKRVTVSAGLSNDTSTEITNGLNEGDIVVTRTTTTSAAAKTTTAPSILNSVGGNRAGGAAGGGNATFRTIRAN